ncbi:cutinase [Mycobacterium sp. 1164966.3]|uniref:cutinase family protein n=1 Tax=Mycobacterium sp. 1164966.3 TaxID=1856861 RepID=UPI0007FF47E5|nr:cutinase family protein [Mycobacterium sp. 1164966.3]OBA82627.1 cutinase [Mycobacterium sp. 1164966.3]
MHGHLLSSAARHVSRLLAPAVVAVLGVNASVLASAIPNASADPCPDVQVVFARGTDDPPGVGPTGQAFIDSLRPRLGAKSLDVYPVDYPATYDFKSAGMDGVRDAGAHVVSMAHDCPNTKLVLGGYSSGAAVMGFVTSPAVPAGIDPASVPKPMDPEVANHVSSVVLYALPSDKMMNLFGAPPVVIGPLYQAKTIQVCAPADPICSDGGSFDVHKAYSTNAPIIDQGAAFAASRLGGGPGAPGTAVASPPSPEGGLGT